MLSFPVGTDQPGFLLADQPATACGQHTVTALGTFATLLVADPGVLAAARDLLAAELAAIDAACSRFRPDSELRRACAAGGRPVPVSPLFAQALSVALAAARLTGGDVDPTCGQALASLGYDRDFASAREDTGSIRQPPAPGGGWRGVVLDSSRQEVTIPERGAAGPGRHGQGSRRGPGGGRDRGRHRQRRARQPGRRHQRGRPATRGRLAGRRRGRRDLRHDDRERRGQPGDRDQGRRPRHVQRAGPRLAARRRAAAPHHRPAHRDARTLLLAYRQRRRAEAVSTPTSRAPPRSCGGSGRSAGWSGSACRHGSSAPTEACVTVAGWPAPGAGA